MVHTGQGVQELSSPMASASGDGGNHGGVGFTNKRVLSIQSHVVSGYVGNKAAVFPLQLLGFDVDIINSVQFSNHTGYPFGFEGEVLDGPRLLKLVDGMERNGLLSSSAAADVGRIGNILTGYIGSKSFLCAVVSVVRKLKGLNPKCRYICDPVLGDHGEFYVPRELVEIYQREVLPLADIITPNQFEVEQLTGISIQSIQDAQCACCALHHMGIGTVLITSIVFPCAGERDSIAMFASRREKSIKRENINDEQYILYTPKLAGQFTGTGDVCAALFLGWTAIENYQNGDKDAPLSSLSSSLEKLASTMHAIVKRTASAADSSSTFTDENIVSSRELRLIQSRDDILYPSILFAATRVPTQYFETQSNLE